MHTLLHPQGPPISCSHTMISSPLQQESALQYPVLIQRSHLHCSRSQPSSILFSYNDLISIAAGVSPPVSCSHTMISSPLQQESALQYPVLIQWSHLHCSRSQPSSILFSYNDLISIAAGVSPPVSCSHTMISSPLQQESALQYPVLIQWSHLHCSTSQPSSILFSYNDLISIAARVSPPVSCSHTMISSPLQHESALQILFSYNDLISITARVSPPISCSHTKPKWTSPWKTTRSACLNKSAPLASWRLISQYQARMTVHTSMAPTPCTTRTTSRRGQSWSRWRTSMATTALLSMGCQADSEREWNATIQASRDTSHYKDYLSRDGDSHYEYKIVLRPLTFVMGISMLVRKLLHIETALMFLHNIRTVLLSYMKIVFCLSLRLLWNL